jgi:hypothetical protein
MRAFATPGAPNLVNSLPNRHIPIIDMFRLRLELPPPSDSSMDPDVLTYSVLPPLDNSLITRFLEELASANKISRSLDAIHYDHGFSPEVIETLITFHSGGLSRYAIVVIFYQAISFCWRCASPSRRGFELLVKVLGRCSDTEPRLSSYFFLQSLCTVLEGGFKWDAALVVTVTDFFLNKSNLTADLAYPFLVRFLRAAVKTDAATAIRFVLEGLSRKLPIFHVRACDDMMQLFMRHFRRLDPAALAILARVSLSEPTQFLLSQFRSVSCGVFDYVERNFDFEKWNVTGTLFETGTESSESLIFDNSFFDAEYPELSEIPAIAEIGFVGKFLAESGPKCAVEFVRQHLELLVTLEDDRYLAQLAVLLVFLDSVSPVVIRQSELCTSFRQCLFNQKNLLFAPETLHPWVSILRNCVAGLVLRCGEMIKFSRSLKSQPLLFAEMIGRARRAFDQSGVEDLLHVAAILQGMPSSKETAIARGIIFLQIFELADVVGFENPLFVLGFLSFLFEPAVSRQVESCFLGSA